MKTLDEIATMAVADVRVEAAQIADTEAALADVRSEVQLIGGPGGTVAARHHRSTGRLVVAAAACVAVVVAAATIGGDDQSVQPAVNPSTTEVAPSTSTGDAVPSMSSPLGDEETGSEIVYQFTRQWEECPPTAYCANPRPLFSAPMATSDGRIVFGEDSVLGSASWLVVDDGVTTKVPVDESWTLRDAAMAPDDTVYAVFTIGDEAFLYRYDHADMSSPVLVDGPEPWTTGLGSVELNVGGASGSSGNAYNDGTFMVFQPLNRPRASLPSAADPLVRVEFIDGSTHEYDVQPVGGGSLTDASVHPLRARVAVIVRSSDLPDAHQFLSVLLPDGTMRQRLLPYFQQVAVSDQRFVDEGYYYLLTAETSTVDNSTTAVYSVRRFALPTADEPPIVMPSTSLPTSTTVLAPPQLTVSGDSLAGLQFGLAVDDSLPQLIATLGEPGSDESLEYTDKVDGGWSNGDEFFEYRYMRLACWGTATITCAVFGGESADHLLLVGWRASAGPNQTSPVQTAAGLRLGSVPAEFGIDVTALQGEVCMGIGYGLTPDGVRIDTLVVGADKSANPDPATIVVIGMSAGELATNSGADC